MTERDFRFGVVAGRAPSGAAWGGIARRAEGLGYDVLLVPDTLQTWEPFAALAAAAAVTTTLRVGTYVLSVPNRPPGLTAWATESLQSISGGRFELGLGGGRPGAERDAAALGADFGTPGDRLTRVGETIDAVRKLADPPRVLVAASGPKMLRLAAEKADTVALGLPPGTTEAELARTVQSVRADRLELHLNLAAVAADVASIPPMVDRMVGGDAQAKAAAGGIAFLTGSPTAMADVLRRRRDEFGISYIGVNALFMDEFAPVVEILRQQA